MKQEEIKSANATAEEARTVILSLKPFIKESTYRAIHAGLNLHKKLAKDWKKLNQQCEEFPFREAALLDQIRELEEKNTKLETVTAVPSPYLLSSKRPYVIFS